MRMVIDIPETDFEYFASTSFVEDDNNIFKQSVADREATMKLFNLIDSVKESISLPKGHGRLIDAKQAEERLRQAFDEHEGYNSLARFIVRNPSETPTIIEADKDGEQE